MSAYTKVNFKADVEDVAPSFSLSPHVEARFGRVPLQCEQQGVSYFRFGPGFRTPFGHRHASQEEVYVLIAGSARIKIEDEILDLAPLDAVRVSAATPRCVEGGPEGGEMIVTGAPKVENDGELLKEWWTD